MHQMVEDKCTEREYSKFKSYIEEVEKITRLLLKLSRRLARAENDLRNAPMATDDEKVCYCAIHGNTTPTNIGFKN